MGAPNISNALKDNADAVKAVQAACDSAAKILNNSEQQGIDYINKHTKGIAQIFEDTFTWYSKFSSDFSLDALNGIIDGIVNTAVDAMKLELTDGTDPDLLVKTATDVGSLIKGVLSLAASSSSTEQNLEVSFSYMVVGDENFAVYLGYNSTTVDAQNAWGHKDIKVVAITYIVAQVKPNPDITRAQMLQDDLNALKIINAKYDKALEDAESQEQVDALNFRKNEMVTLEKKIQADLAQEIKKKT